MKRTSIWLFAAMAIASLTGCSGISPSGDEEAVLIEKPWIFGHGGVDETPVSSGNEWVAISTDAIKFKITPAKYTEEFDNLMTSDNNPVTFSVYITLQAQKGKTPILYKGWGDKWYENSLQAQIRTMVRDKASPFKMFDLTTKREISSQIEQDLTKTINLLIASIKDKDGKSMPINLINVAVGAITPPKEVIDETSKTAAQNQAKLTQDARIAVEQSRKKADVEKANADIAYMETMHFTPDQYLRLRELEIRKETIEIAKDGKQPLSLNVIMGQGQNVTPTVSVSK